MSATEGVRPQFVPILGRLAGERPSVRREVARVLRELADATPALSVGCGELREVARVVNAPVLQRSEAAETRSAS